MPRQVIRCGMMFLGPFCMSTPVLAADEIKIVAGPMFLPSMKEGKVAIWLQTDKGYDVEIHWTAVGGTLPLTKQEMGRRYLCVGLNSSYSLPAGMGIPFDLLHDDLVDVAIYLGDAPEKDATVKPLAVARLPRVPRSSQSGRYTIAFGCCAHQGRFPKQPIWEAIAKERPDCFLFLGDNIYLPKKEKDFPDTRDEVVKLYRELYDKNRRIPELQPLLRSTMTYAIWDDHDFGPNNCDRTWKWKDVALQVFKEYFPGEYGLPDAPGVFYRFAWGDIDVFMLDGRSFRDPNKDKNRKTMLGERQLTWFKEGLAESTATFKLIVCGNQMLSDVKVYETWGGLFPRERDAFLRWLWDRKIEGVIFVSGDVHFGELLKRVDPKKKGPDLWEITSSPLANWFMAARLVGNEHRVAAYDEGMNFGLIRIDTTAKPPTAELLLKDVTGRTVIREVVRR